MLFTHQKTFAGYDMSESQRSGQHSDRSGGSGPRLCGHNAAQESQPLNIRSSVSSRKVDTTIMFYLFKIKLGVNVPLCLDQGLTIISNHKMSHEHSES